MNCWIRGWTLAGAVTALCACATPTPVGRLGPGDRPSRESDEGGLWMQMDRAEESLRTSGHLVRNPDLSRYVSNLVCRIAGPYCSDVRVYVLDTPYANASMAPNGAMQIWTGLFLRAQNEAQLAGVIGHEMAHYLERHSLQRWRDVKSKAGAAAFVGLVSAAAGQWYVGGIANLAATGSILAFSRDQEREADTEGLEMVVRAGYDVREVPKIWDLMMREQEASKQAASSVFFSTHPALEERLKTLTEKAASLGGASEAGAVRADPYRAAIRTERGAWLRQDLRRRDFAGTSVLLEALRDQAPDDGELLYFEGEIHRLRREEGDLDQAIALYRQAAQTGYGAAELYRSLGVALEAAGRGTEARSAYGAYLERNPQAEDAQMVRAYIRQLE